MKKIFCMMMAFVAIGFASCGDKEDSTGDVSVTGVAIVNAEGEAVEAVTLAVEETYQIMVKITPTDATDHTVSYASSDEAVATVSEDGLVKAIAAGTATVTVRTNDGDKTAQLAITVTATDTQDQHEYVDLGLTSGTLWATTNIGAETPQQIGEYFFWGYPLVPEEYTEEKYIELTGNDVHGNIAGTEYDAATVNWGSDWQMPNSAQWKELYDECDMEITDEGVRVKSRVIRDAEIFLPWTFNKDHRGFIDPNIYNHYNWIYMWASDEVEGSETLVYDFYVNQYSVYIPNQESGKYVGYAIRPVRK